MRVDLDIDGAGEKRAGGRAKVDWRGTIKWQDQSLEFVCRDVSKGGLGLVSSVLPDMGQAVWIELETPIGPLRFRGKVVRRDDGLRRKVGIKLAWWSPTTRKSMKQLRGFVPQLAT